MVRYNTVFEGNKTYQDYSGYNEKHICNKKLFQYCTLLKRTYKEWRQRGQDLFLGGPDFESLVTLCVTKPPPFGEPSHSLLEKQNVSILKKIVNIMVETKANSLQFGSNSRIATFWALSPLIL